VASEPSHSKRRLILATLNPGKVRELVRLLADVPVDLVSLADIPGASLPDETGATYAENALIKARAAHGQTGTAALADDSGLEVDALGGAPGVLSARFGGPGLDDAGRVALLLERLRGVPPERRGARFRCVIALVDEHDAEHIVEGVVQGEIATAPRGAGGFGYDPVFVYPPLGRTFGELDERDKEQVSHRGRAAAAARDTFWTFADNAIRKRSTR
jgi:XTP/dITP diphosphohydrolase